MKQMLSQLRPGDVVLDSYRLAFRSVLYLGSHPCPPSRFTAYVFLDGDKVTSLTSTIDSNLIYDVVIRG